jgi:cell wall-associated NlpC family hydrolase
MQAAELGNTLAPGTAPERGDLIFWKRHVGLMLDPVRMLHSNAHYMATVVESLETATARIQGVGEGPVTRHARLDASARAR